MSKIHETTYIDSSARVDREAGIIRGVKILGEFSRNGRRYTPEAMQQAERLYEGAKLYVNHQDRQDVERGADRKFEDFAGVFENVRYKEGEGLFGDERVCKTHEHFERILEAAESFPKAVGHSHVVDAQFRDSNGTELVESIQEVFSVDLVTDPATTTGMFESRRKTMSESDKSKTSESKTEKLTLRRILESTPSNTPRRSVLAEMLEGDAPAAPPELEVEVEEEASPEDKIKEGLMAAIVAKLDNASDEQLQAVMEALELDDSLTASAGNNGGNDGGAEGGEPAETSESRLLAKIAIMEAKTMLLESGREASSVRVKALAATAEGDRKALLESWPIASKPSSGGYAPSLSPPATESGSQSSVSYANKWDQKLAESRQRAASAK